MVCVFVCVYNKLKLQSSIMFSWFSILFALSFSLECTRPIPLLFNQHLWQPAICRQQKTVKKLIIPTILFTRTQYNLYIMPLLFIIEKLKFFSRYRQEIKTIEFSNTLYEYFDKFPYSIVTKINSLNKQCKSTSESGQCVSRP